MFPVYCQGTRDAIDPHVAGERGAMKFQGITLPMSVGRLPLPAIAF
ncbi:MAG: hypothetical protein ACREDM_06200 [Methylocella sp.]